MSEKDNVIPIHHARKGQAHRQVFYTVNWSQLDAKGKPDRTKRGLPSLMDVQTPSIITPTREGKERESHEPTKSPRLDTIPHR